MMTSSSKHFVIPLDTLEVYTSLSAIYIEFESLVNMVRMTVVQRGQAIALLMQGQWQQQVAMQFGVNVSTIEGLVRRPRLTGRLADQPRSGRPRVTSRHQARYTPMRPS